MFPKILYIFLLLLVAVVSASPAALPRPKSLPKPDKTMPELAARTMSLTPPNWTPVINAALAAAKNNGMVGQNSWITTYPPAIAMCPAEIAAITSCNNGYESCTVERVNLEWCFTEMLLWCQADFIEGVRDCLFSDFTNCKMSLDNLYICQAQNTLDPLPSGW